MPSALPPAKGCARYNLVIKLSVTARSLWFSPISPTNKLHPILNTTFTNFTGCIPTGNEPVQYQHPTIEELMTVFMHSFQQLYNKMWKKSCDNEKLKQGSNVTGIQ
jgi:hypothetical protein